MLAYGDPAARQWTKHWGLNLNSISVFHGRIAYAVGPHGTILQITSPYHLHPGPRQRSTGKARNSLRNRDIPFSNEELCSVLPGLVSYPVIARRLQRERRRSQGQPSSVAARQAASGESPKSQL